MNERYLLLQSLPPEDAGWAAYEAQFLDKTPSCPLTADLIALAQGQADPERAAEIHSHLAGGCAHCSRWLEAGQDSWGPAAGADLSGSSLSSHPPPRAHADMPVVPIRSARPGDGLSSLILTNISSMVLAGRVQEALAYLRPYLPEVLEALGLDPALADRLWLFIRDRLQQPDSSAERLHSWLQDFARQHLPGQKLPRRPEEVDLDPVFARCAFRTIQASPRQPAEVRAFLQSALDHGIESDTELELFRLSQGQATRISDIACRDVIRIIRGEKKRVARLFRAG
jgi:hypothetical protein